MRARVDVVVNRLARHLVGEDGVRRAIVDAARDGARVHETRSLADLDAAIAAIARRGTDAVVLAGGDGSYMAGTTALFHTLGEAMPRVAFAPGGTVSTTARNWGFKGDMSRYGGRLVRAVIDGTADGASAVRAPLIETVRPTLRVRDDAGGDRVGFIMGAGLVANFFAAYDASPHQGYGGALFIVSRIFASSLVGGSYARKILEPTPLTLHIDGREQAPRAFSLVAASVVRNLGLHMMLLHRAAEAKDRVHVVASPLPARLLGPQLPLVLAGRRLFGKAHVDTLAGEVRLAFTRAPGAYVLDGETLRAGEVRVTAGPPLRLLSIAG